MSCYQINNMTPPTLLAIEKHVLKITHGNTNMLLITKIRTPHLKMTGPIRKFFSPNDSNDGVFKHCMGIYYLLCFSNDRIIPKNSPPR